MSPWNFFTMLLTYGIFIYAVILVLFYLWIGLYSIGATRKYMRKNAITDYRLLASSPHAPSVSILAPAYNECQYSRKCALVAFPVLQQP
ncbi:hypothetical protein KRR40_28210 [Niabella defluvii]|nr:hypothetical protein KRR40_28210 [Niabella sp. I65]